MGSTFPSITLVGGSGRCGTTVLNEILARHPVAAVSPPVRFMVDPDGVLAFLALVEGAWTPYSVDVAYKRLERLLRRISHATPPKWLHAALATWQRGLGVGLVPQYAHLNAAEFSPGFPGFVDEFLQSVRAFTYPAHWVGTRMLERHEMVYVAPDQVALSDAAARFYRRYAAAAAGARGSSAFIDRNTWNHLWFDRMRTLVPEAKLVHIFRDPRDVVASFARQRWMPRDPVQAARVYQDMMERWWRLRATLPPDSYMELSLEGLVADPRAKLGRVCDFIGLEWDEALLAVPLERANSGRWRRDIDPAQARKVEEILATSIADLGYGRS
jgi:hypothetical protein